MNYEIHDLNDITYSREIMSSKPHPFTAIFIYLIITILLLALTWTYFSEKELVVTSNGVVRPSKEIIKISNKAVGKIENINFKDGDKIKERQVLYTIEHANLDLQKTSIEKEFKLKNDELENTKKLKKSIEDGKNYFNSNTENEKSYYTKYEKYSSDCKDINNQSKTVQTQIQNVKETLDSLDLLQKSVNENKNYLKSDSSYYNQYLDYQYNLEQYQLKLNQVKNNQNVQGSVVQDSKSTIDNINKEVEKYKNQYTLNIKSNIEQNKSKLKELDNSLNNGVQSKDVDMTIEKYKTNTLLQLDDNIKAVQEKVDEINLNLKAVNNNIDDCTVKASSNGVINSLVEINKGDLLQSGIEIATVLPEEDSQYKIQLCISNKDIGNIKVDQKVKCNFLALPYREYGNIEGKITKISADAKVNPKEGTSFYTAEATLVGKSLYSHKKEKADIKTGMVCETQVVTRTEKMLYYLLEKLNLKD